MGHAKGTPFQDRAGGCPLASPWCRAGAGHHPCPCSHTGAPRVLLPWGPGWASQGTLGGCLGSGVPPRLQPAPLPAQGQLCSPRKSAAGSAFNPFWAPGCGGQSGLVGLRAQPAGDTAHGGTYPLPGEGKVGARGAAPCPAQGPAPRPRRDPAPLLTAVALGCFWGAGERAAGAREAVGGAQRCPPPIATPWHGKSDSSLQQKREAKPSASAPGRGSPRGFSAGEVQQPLP